MNDDYMKDIDKDGFTKGGSSLMELTSVLWLPYSKKTECVCIRAKSNFTRCDGDIEIRISAESFLRYAIEFVGGNYPSTYNRVMNDFHERSFLINAVYAISREFRRALKLGDYHKKAIIDGIPIDIKLSKTIRKLWDNNIKTWVCCQGGDILRQNYVDDWSYKTILGWVRRKSYIYIYKKYIVEAKKFLPDNTYYDPLDSRNERSEDENDHLVGAYFTVKDLKKQEKINAD